MANAADADGEQHTSEAEVASCWRPASSEGASGAVETESGVIRRSGKARQLTLAFGNPLWRGSRTVVLS